MRNSATSSGLFTRYVNDECTSEEIRMLLTHFDTGGDEVLLKELIRKELETGAAGTESQDLLKPVLEDAFTSIKQRTVLRIPSNSVSTKTGWKRFAAAAAVLFVLAATAAYFYTSSPKSDSRITGGQPAPASRDIRPGGNRAVLTLADGTTILLDSAAKGSFATQGNIHIIKSAEGMLSYVSATGDKVPASPENANLFNTISTPKGGQYQLVLPDGSKVWLNAATSLHFPVAFNAEERQVILTGEAYFEIAKDPARPFKVKQGSIEVRVLGTSFNMNAYGNEDEIRTTLLEGSVKVISNRSEVLLKPGQAASIAQAERNRDKPVIYVQPANTEDAVAWKNGMFVFNNADIRTIMRQISRWYDVDVKFEGAMPVDKFTGEVPRSSNVSEVLKILELNNIHFKINDKTITVTP